MGGDGTGPDALGIRVEYFDGVQWCPGAVQAVRPFVTTPGGRLVPPHAWLPPQVNADGTKTVLLDSGEVYDDVPLDDLREPAEDDAASDEALGEGGLQGQDDPNYDDYGLDLDDDGDAPLSYAHLRSC